jgi:hypothetical protein
LFLFILYGIYFLFKLYLFTNTLKELLNTLGLIYFYLFTNTLKELLNTLKELLNTLGFYLFLFINKTLFILLLVELRHILYGVRLL